MEEEGAELKRKNTDAAYQGTAFTFKGYLGGKHQCRIMFNCCPINPLENNAMCTMAKS